MLPTIFLGIALLVFSGVLVWTHLRTWRAAAEGELSERDRRFAWRQFRRRMQSSAMIGIAAVAIMVAPFLLETSVVVSVFYLVGLLLLVLWIILLAVVDAIATRRHYVTLQHGELNRMASDNAEARRRQEAGDDDLPA
ncbi:MAG: hypothetical protein IIA67_10995 [Planctomycetes bacterium]|nr:hypothetical protein [Planctomycetota bacterium]